MCFCKGHIDRPEQYIEGLQVYLHKLLSLILLFVGTVEAFFDLIDNFPYVHPSTYGCTREVAKHESH